MKTRDNSSEVPVSTLPSERLVTSIADRGGAGVSEVFRDGIPSVAIACHDTGAGRHSRWVGSIARLILVIGDGHRFL